MPVEKPKSKNEKKGKDVVEEKKPEKPKTPNELFDILISDVVAAVTLIERSVSDDERKFALRALRRNSSLRRRVNANVFAKLLPLYYPKSMSEIVDKLLIYTSSIPVKELKSTEMAVDDETNENETAPKEITGDRNTILPEVDVYFRLLVTLFMLDNEKIDEANDVVSGALAIVRDKKYARQRSLEPLSWRIERYAALIDEKRNESPATSRSEQLAALRRASLRSDIEGAATLLNILLRGYVAEKNYLLAHKLLVHTALPIESVSSSQLARMLYYEGRIKAVQLEYSAAFTCLSQAGRKAPRSGAKGFRIAVARAATVVQLLMGEVPDRASFADPALKSYLELARAVRVGDVRAYERVVKEHSQEFKNHSLLTLIERLRHNVLKIGLRKLSVSYSRISLEDVAQRLDLQSAADAESIIAKAVRDGVIDAEIDHKESFVRSKTADDVYATYEPTNAFHTRVDFCLKMRDEAVQAMRYPDSSSRLAAEQKERERADREERELANSLEDDDEEEI